MTYLRTEVDGWTVYDDDGPSVHVGSVVPDAEANNLFRAFTSDGRDMGAHETPRAAADALVAASKPPPPKRVQRTRGKGGGIPAGAVYVGRPTRWGNPFRVVKTPGWPRWAGVNPRQVVTPDGKVWDWPPGDEPPRIPVVFGQAPDFIDGNAYREREATRLAVHLFALHTGPMGAYEYDADDLSVLRATLRGRDLACWCPIGTPCHADHLLTLANEGPDQ